MSNRFEIIHLAADGEVRVLSRFVPNKYSKRWHTVWAMAAVVLGTPLEEAQDNEEGLLFAVRSPFRRDLVGIRERE